METSPALFKALNGIFCLYKPAQKSLNDVIRTLQMNLARELNKLPCRPMRTKLHIKDGLVPIISTLPDLADHPLVVGQRYTEEDFRIASVDGLKFSSSGVSIFGIGNGVSLLRTIGNVKHLRVYHVDGELGRVSMDNMASGRIVERTTFHHITHARIDRIVAGMQAGHQKHMYQAAGVDLESQDAYNLACSGMLRPSSRGFGPVVYGMKCILFNPPHFTLEIHAINEKCDYLAKLIHNIGLEARSSAVCSKIRRIKYGHFGLDQSILLKHASDPFHLVKNIKAFQLFLTPDKLLYYPTIGQFDNKSFPDPSVGNNYDDLDSQFLLSDNKF